jgi:uncharacterized membrane protein
MQGLDTHIARDGFHLRGTSMSRVDAFSDVVFGFALTLLVVSLEVPRTYAELHASLRGFIPFAICFALLFNLWYTHFEFFRRFGLHDLATVTINAALLFFVLFYVYPLKFLFNMLVNNLHGHAGASAFESPDQPSELMLIYGLGYTAIYLLFTALYANGYRQRHLLGLSPLETVLAQGYIAEVAGMACIGVICCLLAVLLPARMAGLAGFSFFLIPVFKTLHGRWTGKRSRRASMQPV